MNCFSIYHDLKVRFVGINAPEKNTQEGKDAKAWLEAQLPVGGFRFPAGHQQYLQARAVEFRHLREIQRVVKPR